MRARVSTRRGVSSVQQSWSGSSEMARVRIRRASAMISVLSHPSSGRRIGRCTASSRAVMFGSVWLETWPRESPVIKAVLRSRFASACAVLSISRRCAITWSRSAPELASACCAFPNGTTNSLDPPWNLSSPRTSAYAL